MAVTQDIAATWRGPSAVFDRMIRGGQGDDVILIHAILGGLLHFVAMAPAQSRAAFLDPSVPLEARLFWAALFFVLVLPLGLWLITLILGGIAGLFGKKQFGRRLRLSLFWALLAASPAALLVGLTAGFVGEGSALSLTSLVWVGAALYFYVKGIANPAWRPEA